MTTPHQAVPTEEAEPRAPISHRASRRPPYRSGGEPRRWYGQPKSWLRYVGTAVAIVVTLVAGQAIIRLQPDYNSTEDPFFYQGGPGERVIAGDLAVTLLGVRGAAKAGPQDGPYADTAGVWIVVKVRLEATSKSINTGYIALADPEGRTFRATERFKQPLSENVAELRPGIPTEGEIAFEVPKSDGPGLTLRMGENAADITGGRMSAYTDIRLPVADGDVSRWLADPDPAEIGKPKVGG